MDGGKFFTISLNPIGSGVRFLGYLSSFGPILSLICLCELPLLSPITLSLRSSTSLLAPIILSVLSLACLNSAIVSSGVKDLLMYLPRDLLLDLLMNLPLDNRLSLDTDLSLILPLLGGGDRDTDLSQRISIEEDLLRLLLGTGDKGGAILLLLGGDLIGDLLGNDLFLVTFVRSLFGVASLFFSDLQPLFSSSDSSSSMSALPGHAASILSPRSSISSHSLKSLRRTTSSVSSGTLEGDATLSSHVVLSSDFLSTVFDASFSDPPSSSMSGSKSSSSGSPASKILMDVLNRGFS